MNVVEVEQIPLEYVGALVNQPVNAMEPTVESPAKLVDVDTGESLAFVLRCDQEQMTRLRQAARQYPMSTTLRSSGLRNLSNAFGYISRNAVLRREGCRSCSGSIEAPDAHQALVDAAATFSAMFAEVFPSRAQADQELAGAAILPEWRMAGTQWTSGVLNETSSLPYHRDANNLPTWNAMVVMRRGTRGGHFDIPEYGQTLACRDGDVVLMPAYKTLHGVTPIRKVDPDGYRYIAVYYSVARMRACLSFEEETAFARATRSEREDTLLERQRESGMME
jgi:hypothetical protein